MPVQYPCRYGDCQDRRTEVGRFLSNSNNCNKALESSQCHCISSNGINVTVPDILACCIK